MSHRTAPTKEKPLNKAGLLGEIAAEINISRGDSAHYECFEAVF